MKEVCEKLKPYLVIIIFSVYVLFNGVLLWYHEPWRDEANVWLMARDLSPLQLLREIKYQGHPCLWYFLVMPFAKFGLPFRTIGMISTMVMTVAAGIYLFLSDDCSELLSDSLDFDLAGMELFREKCTSGSLWNIAWFVGSG